MTNLPFPLDHPRVLRRFRIGALLGEGADSQAFLAADSLGEGGEAAVVVKRAHPSLVSRGLHDDVERRMAAQARFRREFAPDALPRLLAATRADRFGWLFGDDLANPYMALAEDRARGVPLVGSVADQVRGRPVGLPMSLFVLHPPAGTRAQSPAMDVLRLIEFCAERGMLALDLGPRNVFYNPSERRTTVVDLGGLEEPRAATRRREALDVNDILLEFFAAYTTPDDAPRTADGHLEVREVRLSGNIERRARTLADEFSARSAGGRRTETARHILDRIGHRAYQTTADFRADFLAHLQAADEESSWDEAASQARRDALGGLGAAHWGKFAFEADDAESIEARKAALARGSPSP